MIQNLVNNILLREDKGCREILPNHIPDNFKHLTILYILVQTVYNYKNELASFQLKIKAE